MIRWQVLDTVIWIWATMIIPIFLIIRDPTEEIVSDRWKDISMDFFWACVWPITLIESFIHDIRRR